MEKSTTFNKYLGTLIGLAAGDALGFPTEFKNREQISEIYGKEGIDSFQPYYSFPLGSYSDDTQMSIAVTKGLLNADITSQKDIISNVSREFIDWYNSSENNRFPGTSCLKGIENLIETSNPYMSGVIGATGCGAAMRSAPIGLLFYDDLDQLKNVACDLATITHDSDIARASAVANAYLVARGIREEPTHEALAAVRAFTYGMSDKMTEKLDIAEQSLSLPVYEGMDTIGLGWNGDSAVALGIYAALKADFDYNQSIMYGANSNGDSDSVASIAGGIVGAHAGYNAIDARFLKRLENRDYLFSLAKSLFEKKQQ